MLENGDLVLHFWDSDMGPELETKSHVFTAWKQGTVLWGPKTSCRRCFGDSKSEGPRHVSEARPKTQCWVFSDWKWRLGPMLVGLRKRLHAPFWGLGHGDWVSSGGIEPSTREQAPCLLSVTSLPCRAKQRSDCWLLRSGSVEGIALLQRSLALAGLVAEAAPQGNFQWLRHGQLSRAVSHFSNHFNSCNRVTFKKVNAGICQATNHKGWIRDYLAACDLVPQHHEEATRQTRASTSSFVSLMHSSHPSRCPHCISRAGHRSTLSPAGHQGHAPGMCPRGARVVLLPGPCTPSSKGSMCTKGPATWDMNLPCRAILPCSSFQQEQPTPAPPESSRGQDVASQCHWRGFQSLHLFQQNVPK